MNSTNYLMRMITRCGFDMAREESRNRVAACPANNNIDSVSQILNDIYLVYFLSIPVALLPHHRRDFDSAT